MSNPIQVVLEFEKSINARSPEQICVLMTTDGEFIDSLGNRIQATDRLRTAWEGYFKIVPDYSISHSEIFADGNTVAVFGSAQGTFSRDGQLRKENLWKTPAAWRAVVKDNKIALWQVYADNEPIRAIIEVSFYGAALRIHRKGRNGRKGNLAMQKLISTLAFFAPVAVKLF